MAYVLDYTASEVNRAVGRAKDMADYPVDAGSSGGWTWRKWKSGTSECWGMFGTGNLIMEASGNVYVSTVQGQPFPSGLFSDNPIALVNIQAAGGVIGAKGTGASDKNTLRYQIVKSHAGTEETNFAAHCYGHWR